MELIFEVILNLGLIVLSIFDYTDIMSDSKLDEKSMKKIRHIQICRNGLMIVLMISFATTIPVVASISIWFIVPVALSIIAIIALMVYTNIKYFKQKNSKI